jgi:DNA segregation ATPase FtsK/SpoIIIE, S-DNA-T family
MAKKNRSKHTKTPAKKLFSVSTSAQRTLFGTGMIALAGIFLFSFFGKAGGAGQLFFSLFSFLMGKTVFLIPLLCVLAGLVFLGMKGMKAGSLFFAMLLFGVGVEGIVGSAARATNVDVEATSGFLGLILSWPVFGAFGFWVSEIIFSSVAVAAAFILWQLLDHTPAAPSSFIATPSVKIKKIEEEPKFEVKGVVDEPKIVNGNIDKKPSFEPLPVVGDYQFPPLDLLEAEHGTPNAGDVKIYSAIIKKTLANFDIPVEISEVNIGPAVTQYAFKPAEGIKLSRIVALSNDLSLALAAHPIRIEAPIPGRSLVGIEIPNRVRTVVRLRNIMENTQFRDSVSPLLLGLGKDVAGNHIFADLARMPHLLIAGATGTGKTIGLNNIILSLIYRNPPSRLRFILVDPKRVEFPVYNELPHLLTPVILDTQRAINALKWLVKEMERRFQVLSGARCRDIGSYHQMSQTGVKDTEEFESMPYIVLIIDELADLMAARGKELEGLIVRLAQMARAVGIHLVLATQRPSVEVITGLIKANITSRVAFQVASQVDSRTILDGAGAEKLLGQGDMLYISSDFTRPRRIQGAYVSDKDVKKVANWISKESKEFVRDHIGEDELSQSAKDGVLAPGALETSESDDPLYEEAKRVVIEAKKASASLLQRRLKVGYARAARLLDILEERGVVGPGEGAKPREVYGISQEEGGEASQWFSP